MVMFLTDNIAKKADTAKQQKPHRFCSKKEQETFESANPFHYICIINFAQTNTAMIHFSGTDYCVTLNKDLDGLKEGSFVIISKKLSLLPNKPTLSEISEAFQKKHNKNLRNATINDFKIKKVQLIR